MYRARVSLAGKLASRVLVKHKWPDVDIYRILGWLKEVWPAVFGPR